MVGHDGLSSGYGELHKRWKWEGAAALLSSPSLRSRVVGMGYLYRAAMDRYRSPSAGAATL